MSETEKEDVRFVSRLTRKTFAIVLAGGRGSRLKHLTTWRAKPAMPFGGKFRIIDFTLSNCINSGIRRMAVLTQYKAHSLLRHIQNGWGFMRGQFGEFIELLPAQQRLESSWYLGTADAVYQNMDIIRSHAPEYVLILAGDHVYKMDYGKMLAFHTENNADLTVGCIEVPKEDAVGFGVMDIDKQGRIVDFVEKPERPPEIPGMPGVSMASMGIYVFNTEKLLEELVKDADNKNSDHDFGKNIIPSMIEKDKVFAYRFSQSTLADAKPYWRDVGTVDNYWKANLELVEVNPELNLYDHEWPIWTYQEQVPPAKFVHDDETRHGMALNSIVSGGCIISGALIKQSLLFTNVRVEQYSLVENSVVMPEVHIGEHCVIKNAIIDKGTKVPARTQIGVNPEEDAKRFYISPGGVVLVVPDMLGQRIHEAR